MLDSRVMDVRIVYTDAFLWSQTLTESNGAGQYEEFNR